MVQARAAAWMGLICALVAQPAWPGAWLRDKDSGFLSVVTNIRNDPAGVALETDIYAEYGAWKNVTLGVAINEIQGLRGHVLGFARFPIATRSDSAKWAVEAGIGAWHMGPVWQPMGKLTLAYGRGFSWGEAAHGWLSVEASLEHRQGKPDPTWALNATLGQSAGRRVRPMIKLGTEYIAGQPLNWSASGHLLIDGPKDTTWVLGIERKRAGTSSTALSLGIWRNF